MPCVLALAKYRSAIPLTLALCSLDDVTRSLVVYYSPIKRTSDTGGLVVDSQVLFAVMLAAVVLSLRCRRNATLASVTANRGSTAASTLQYQAWHGVSSRYPILAVLNYQYYTILAV